MAMLSFIDVLGAMEVGTPPLNSNESPLSMLITGSNHAPTSSGRQFVRFRRVIAVDSRNQYTVGQNLIPKYPKSKCCRKAIDAFRDSYGKCVYGIGKLTLTLANAPGTYTI